MAISYSLHFQAPATVRNGSRSPTRDGSCLFKHPLREAHEPTGAATGWLRVIEARPFDALVKPVKNSGRPALTKGQIPDGAYARLVRRAIDFQVRVAQPLLPPAPTRGEVAALEAIGVLAARTLSTGIRLTWVQPGESAELRLSFTPENAAECPSDRLWIAGRDGSFQCTGPERTYALPLDDPLRPVDSELPKALQASAKVPNLHRIAKQLDKQATMTDLKISFEITSDPASPDLDPVDTEIRTLEPGDRIRISAENSGISSVDLTVLFIDGRFGIKVFHPEANQSARLGPGERKLIGTGRVTSDPAGIEHLIIIAVAAEPASAEVAFGHLAQPTLERDARETQQPAHRKRVGASVRAGWLWYRRYSRRIGHNASTGRYACLSMEGRGQKRHYHKLLVVPFDKLLILQDIFKFHRSDEGNRTLPSADR